MDTAAGDRADAHVLLDAPDGAAGLDGAAARLHAGRDGEPRGGLLLEVAQDLPADRRVAGHQPGGPGRLDHPEPDVGQGDRGTQGGGLKRLQAVGLHGRALRHDGATEPHAGGLVEPPVEVAHLAQLTAEPDLSDRDHVVAERSARQRRCARR